MKRKVESCMDDLVQRNGQIAESLQELERVAVPQYAMEVEDILKTQNRDSRRIERCLDLLLDFCWDDEMLALFKNLCHYYFNIDPEATASYVHAYRERWDTRKSCKVSSERLKRTTAASGTTVISGVMDGK